MRKMRGHEMDSRETSSFEKEVSLLPIKGDEISGVLR